MKRVGDKTWTGTDSLLKAPLELSTEDPVLRPFAAVDVSLRVVVTNSLFFGNIIGVACESCTFGRRKVWSLRGLRAWCEQGR